MSIHSDQRNEAAVPAPIAHESTGFPTPGTRGKALLIAALAVLVYLPSLNGEFILDDDLLLTNNAQIRSPDGWLRVWYTPAQPDYVPLTSTSLWLEWRLWGMHSTGYHVTNLLLHIAAALLIWAILQKLSIAGAFLAALLFTVHPVNVESVVWVEQRKNTLAMLFFLLSILWFLRDEQIHEAELEAHSNATGLWYWLSLAAFALAMFSKGSVAILPLVLLGIVWWRRRRLAWNDVLYLAPFFVVTLVLTPVIIWFVTHGAEVTVRHATWVQRLWGAGAVIWFYLSKALLPIDLSFIYPQWYIRSNEWLWWLPTTAAALTTVALWQCRHQRYGRPLLFAWGFFVVALAPVLGFTDSGFSRYSLVADHYQHIAMIGVLALAASGWSAWYEHSTGSARSVAAASAVVLVGGLALLSWNQSRLYDSAITLYETTLQSNPRSELASLNLGVALAKANRLDEAARSYQRALQIKPDYAEAHNDLGIVLLDTGHSAEAIAHFEQALKLKPDNPETCNNLANALLNAGRLGEAIEYFKQALFLKHDYVDAHYNLGKAYLTSGAPDEAIQQYEAALALSPDDADAELELGIALCKAARAQEAIAHLERALQLRPGSIEIYHELTTAYDQVGRREQALAVAQVALDVARSRGDQVSARKIEEWIANYRTRQAPSDDASRPQSPRSP